jgi:hypothetical protein
VRISEASKSDSNLLFLNYSTDEGLVRAGPDYSCVVNTSGELRMFGGSKTRFACLGARDVEELWEQRTVYHDLADKK